VGAGGEEGKGGGRKVGTMLLACRLWLFPSPLKCTRKRQGIHVTRVLPSGRFLVEQARTMSILPVTCLGIDDSTAIGEEACTQETPYSRAYRIYTHQSNYSWLAHTSLPIYLLNLDHSILLTPNRGDEEGRKIKQGKQLS